MVLSIDSDSDRDDSVVQKTIELSRQMAAMEAATRVTSIDVAEEHAHVPRQIIFFMHSHDNL